MDPSFVACRPWIHQINFPCFLSFCFFFFFFVGCANFFFFFFFGSISSLFFCVGGYSSFHLFELLFPFMATYFMFVRQFFIWANFLFLFFKNFAFWVALLFGLPPFCSASIFYISWAKFLLANFSFFSRLPFLSVLD